MLDRLARMLLALVTALVFTGQVEAAAAHCGRLAAESAAVAAPLDAEQPCHEHAAAGEDAKAVPEQPTPQPDQPATERCECVAVLMGCASIAIPTASTHIEPYAWARPEVEGFASVEPSPGLRPPRS